MDSKKPNPETQRTDGWRPEAVGRGREAGGGGKAQRPSGQRAGPQHAMWLRTLRCVFGSLEEDRSSGFPSQGEVLCDAVRWWMVTDLRLTVPQCVHTSGPSAVCLKHIQCYTSITSRQKREKKDLFSFCGNSRSFLGSGPGVFRGPCAAHCDVPLLGPCGGQARARCSLVGQPPPALPSPL